MDELSVTGVEAITEPLERLLAADVAMYQRRRTQENLSNIRLRAMRAYVDQVGPIAAADRLHVQRPNLHRAMQHGLSTSDLEDLERRRPGHCFRCNAPATAVGTVKLGSMHFHDVHACGKHEFELEGAASASSQ